MKEIDIQLRQKRVNYWERHRSICKIEDLLDCPKEVKEE